MLRKLIYLSDELTIQRSVFANIRDVIRYRRLSNGKSSDKSAVALYLREAEGMMLARPHTSDAKVLWDTFYHRYHLPPIELDENCTILDLGANVGYTAAHFAFRFPTARIIAVEMDQENFQQLALNTRAVGNRCSLINAAVWSHDGMITYGGDAEWAYHVNVDSGSRSAQAITLDSIFIEQGINEVDYLKMDIEGSEMALLQESSTALRRVRAIKVEMHPQFNRESTLENCIALLRDLGFASYKDPVHRQCVMAVR